MSELPLITKSQFKETARYLQQQLTEELGQKIKLSTAQEALSRSMGFNDYHSYQHYIDVMGQTPTKAEWANGDIAKEIQSLRFCIEAAKGASGTQSRIRSILLHLYNNDNPTKIDLKNFDRTHAIHLLNALALDSRPFKEIHHYIEGTDGIIRRWAEQAHEDREWAKYEDGIYDFIGRLQRIEGMDDAEEFANIIKREWEYRINGLPPAVLSGESILSDGYYRWRILSQDEYDYEYSVCIEFNIVEGKIFVCEDLPINQKCETGLICDRVNQEYQNEIKEFDEKPYLGYRGYFK
ncbi:MAG: hypothetical protein U9Q62_04570 [Campylobacterota bacterium]|nr:hypothetical protein [Campylobacterota bacterium]